jgi:beta-aspartyl-peptidase (threonine type)
MSGGLSGTKRMDWAIIVHGGAKDVAPADRDANVAGCRAAVLEGLEILREGGRAVEAVAAAIRCLEDDPVFNAGRGAVLRADGSVQLDAALMDGRTLDIGAVGAVEGLKNPISVARAMLYQPPTLLVGGGARAFAAETGQALVDPLTLIQAADNSSEVSPCDTVGCVAIDANGDLAAGTSTGGLPGSPRGRMGDSALPGCGFYCDNQIGGASLSGDGEQISRMLLAGSAIELLRTCDAETSARTTIERLSRVGGEAGVILINRLGQIGWAHNSRNFVVGTSTRQRPDPAVSLEKGP